MPTTWEGVGQTVAVILFIAWGLALLVPAMIYLASRAASRAQLASDLDRNIIDGSANRSGVPAVRPDSEVA